jgi:hypothetical protein
MLNPNFVIVAVVLQFLASLGYLRDTITGRVQPNRVSWLLWSIAPLIAFFAEIKQGVGVQAWVTFIAGFVPVLVFLASFINKKSQWHLGKIDLVCGVLSVLGLILWGLTRIGNIAILFSILADGLAAVPTIVKSYYHPESESYPVYFFSIVSSFVALLTLTNWNFQSYAFLVYLLVINTIFVLLIRFNFGKLISARISK